MTEVKQSKLNKERLLLIVILIFVLFYTVMVAIAPIRKLSELKKMVYADSVYYAKNEAILQDRSLFDLAKTKAFKEAQLKLAQKDTFGLVINLNDSTVLLMLKGVTIHSAKIYNFQKDRFFDGLNPIVYTKLFSTPLRTQLEYSTIVKEPIIIKKAPKDTVEAISNAYMPDTLIQDPAYLRLELEQGFNLIMVQNEFNTPEGKKVEKEYLGDIKKRKMGDVMRNFANMKQASYTPNLILYLDADELRSAYRAIPDDALVIFNY